MRYNGDVAPFTNWHSREPNERGNYECAFQIWHVAGGKWYTKACDIDTDIVCERPYGTTTTTPATLPGIIRISFFSEKTCKAIREFQLVRMAGRMSRVNQVVIQTCFRKIKRQ